MSLLISGYSLQDITPLRVPIPPVERDHATGGFQNLILRLQAGVHPSGDGTYALRCSAEDAERIPKYAYGHGEGGFQNRLRPLVPRVLEVLKEVEAQQGTLFGEDDD